MQDTYQRISGLPLSCIGIPGVHQYSVFVLDWNRVSRQKKKVGILPTFSCSIVRILKTMGNNHYSSWPSAPLTDCTALRLLYRAAFSLLQLAATRKPRGSMMVQIALKQVINMIYGWVCMLRVQNGSRSIGLRPIVPKAAFALMPFAASLMYPSSLDCMSCPYVDLTIDPALALPSHVSECMYCLGEMPSYIPI